MTCAQVRVDGIQALASSVAVADVLYTKKLARTSLFAARTGGGAGPVTSTGTGAPLSDGETGQVQVEVEADPDGDSHHPPPTDEECVDASGGSAPATVPDERPTVDLLSSLAGGAEEVELANFAAHSVFGVGPLARTSGGAHQQGVAAASYSPNADPL